MNSEAVKPGYKKTEVGVIPEDWDIKKIGELTSCTSGGTPNTNIRSYWDGKIQWMSSGELHLKLITDVEGRITDEGLQKSSAKIIPKRCILIGLAGQGKTRGTVAINMIEICTNQSIGAILPNYTFIPEYLYYNLDNRYNELRELSTGAGGRGGLNLSIINSISVSLPNKIEQRAIAAALSDADALIRSLDALIEKKRSIKQAAMQQLLTGKMRLPRFEGEWEEKHLADIIDKQIPFSFSGGPFGSNLKTSEYTPTGVRIIQLQNIGDGTFNEDYAIYTSDAKADELISCNIFPGEIIISKMGDPVARACLVPTQDKRYLMASDGIRLAVDKKQYSNLFALHYINYDEFRKNAIESSTGSTRMRIGLSELKRLPFRAPKLEEQYAIATVLSDMDAEITALEHRRDKVKQIKQGMMQQLLTGKVRLVLPEREGVNVVC